MLRDLPSCRLVIIGDGPERRRLATVLPEAIFTGMLHGDDLARTVASLDVLVTPGESETFCQVVQEAMASGVPVVAPAAGGPLDLIDHSRTGWLYPPGQLMIMRDRVRDLVGDEAKREAFGRAARASVLHRGWHRSAPNWSATTPRRPTCTPRRGGAPRKVADVTDPVQLNGGPARIGSALGDIEHS